MELTEEYNKKLTVIIAKIDNSKKGTLQKNIIFLQLALIHAIEKQKMAFEFVNLYLYSIFF